MPLAASSSDPFDVDDDIFADPMALDELEASAIQASQAPAKQRVIQPYHHTVAKPKTTSSVHPGAITTGTADPSILKSGQLFSGRKAPQPLNTEPRAGSTGFGWEYGGKRSMEGNVERHVENVRKRQEYWSKSTMSFGDTPRNGGQDAETDRPDIVMGENGYELGTEPEVVDSHSTRKLQLPPASQNPRNTAAGAAARRAAIAKASQSMNTNGVNAVAGPSHIRRSSAGAQALAPPNPFPSRTLSRSVSAGHHPMNTGAASHRMPGRLSPIPSEEAGSNSSSQGSIARKTVFQLEEEKKRSEALEREVASLREQLDNSKKEKEDVKAREVVSRADDLAKTSDIQDVQAKIDELQNQLWKAKGEAETVRRNQQIEHNRAIAEAERLRKQIADLEARDRQRERENARQVENVKTQAIFANHAALNSAAKARAASQRPLPLSPVRNGSPRGKTDQYSLPQSIKGKGRAPPPPAPRFDSFKDGFANTPTLTRVKRARTGSVTPAPLFPQTMATRRLSPRRQQTDVDMVSPSKKTPPRGVAMDVDLGQADAPLGMDIDAPLGDDVPANEPAWPYRPEKRQELLYHLFHQLTFSAFQQRHDERTFIRPVLYRILHYEPVQAVDPDRRISGACSTLLQTCGDSNADYEQVLASIGDCGVTILEILLPDLELGTWSDAEMSTVINIMAILGRTARLFHEFSPSIVARHPEFTTYLERLATCISNRCQAIEAEAKAPKPIPSSKEVSGRQVSPPRQQDNPSQGGGIGAVIDGSNAPDEKSDLWLSEVSFDLSELCQAMCWYSGDTPVWNGEELVNICMSLMSAHCPIEIKRNGVDIAFAAATFSENFRALIATSHKYPGDSPVLEKLSRFLIKPPKVKDEDRQYILLTVIRALSMLSIADTNAIILIAERTLVVPALILLLTRESDKVWGIYSAPVNLQAVMDLVQPALQLLHHLVFPIQFPAKLSKALPSPLALDRTPGGPGPGTGPSSSQRQRIKAQTLDYTSAGHDPEPDPENEMQGINLVQRLRDTSQVREFHAIGHQFISCFGALSYATPARDTDDLKGFDLTTLQYMSQDILDTVVEGPEADAVYEAYADEDEDLPEEGDEGGDGAAGAAAGVRFSGPDEADGRGEEDLDVADAETLEAFQAVEDDEGGGGGDEWNAL